MTTATATKRRKAGGGGPTWTIPATELAAALRAVAPAVSPRHATLSHVRVGSTIEATNGDMRITVDVGAWDEPVLIPHARLEQIVRTVHGDVQIERGPTSVTITAARGRWTLPTADALEWPPAPSAAAPRPLCHLPADQFARSVAAVIDAADSESSRYALGGVLIAHKGPHVAFVATDGRRLHLATADIDQATDDAQVIVPRAAMAVLARMADGAGDDGVQLSISGADIVAEFPDVTVWARLLDGRFPSWLDVVPAHVRPRFGSDDDTYQEPPAHAEISAGELLAAVRQAAIVTSEQSRGVEFSFVPNGLCLTARSADYGESTVTADLLRADISTTVKLDPAFVSEWVRTLDAGATVEVFATDASSAVILRHEDQIGVVMPLALD